jgi:hypothetical protein
MTPMVYHSVATGLTMCFGIAYIARMWMVTRTAAHYRMTTIAWTLAPLIILSDLGSPFFHVGSPREVILDGVRIGIDVFLVWTLWNSNDDNWWRRKRRALRDRLRRLGRSPKLATAGAR